MPGDPKEETRPPGELGFTRTPSEDDPRREPALLEAIATVAPGTALRQAVDDVIRSHEGALIVIGDPHELAFLYSGGIRLDAPFRPQLLYELSKMDGAIIVDSAIKRLAWANVQLMPDPTIPSDQTGTRHRTAERVAKQTGALVVSVSQQRETVTVFVGQSRYQLDPVAVVLAKTNQALGTLETYRLRLEQVLTRNPDVILTVFHSGQPLPELKKIAGWRALDAVKGGRVYVLDEVFQHPSPRFVDGVEELARKLHPERFQ